jgi:UDP-N-acetyl-2-amino-2-deoxyglucuronate dehydrogenase
MDNQKKFAIIGVGGYIAVRHLKAIKDTRNILLATLDPSDSVGIIDSYFPDSHFFVEFERFDRHVDKLRRSGVQLDYVSICSPNYLHDSHIRFALRSGASAICEKPLVLNPWNIDALAEIEKEYNRKINTILQLRLHPVLVELKRKVDSTVADNIHNLDLTYITSRGNWYFNSWKGDVHKSGGIATNIGIHFFDMLTWIFGKVQKNTVHLLTHDKAGGYLELEKARVRWFLSLDYKDLPESVQQNGKHTYRSIVMDKTEIEFSEGFTDLHTKSYEGILTGRGFGLKDAQPSVEIVYQIRNATPIGLKGEYHELCKKALTS